MGTLACANGLAQAERRRLSTGLRSKENPHVHPQDDRACTRDVHGPRQPAARRCRPSRDVLREDVPELRRRLRGRRRWTWRQCIRLCLDCADICDAAANLGLRRTGIERADADARCSSCAPAPATHARPSARSMTTSIASCARQMCRECAEDCRNAAAEWSADLPRRGGGPKARRRRPLHHARWSPPVPGRIRPPSALSAAWRAS